MEPCGQNDEQSEEYSDVCFYNGVEQTKKVGEERKVVPEEIDKRCDHHLEFEKEECVGF